MDWKYLFTSFDGRINRKPYWIGSLVLAISGVLIQLLLLGIFGPLATLIFGIVWLFPYFALMLKRAHDRNRPTWLIAVFFAFMIVASLMRPVQVDSLDRPTIMFTAIAIPWLLLSLFLFVDLGFLRGTPGPNRYGPDPLG